MKPVRVSPAQDSGINVYKKRRENTNGNSAIAKEIFRKLFLKKQNENLRFNFVRKKCTNPGEECRNSGSKKQTFQENNPQPEWMEHGEKRVIHVVIHIIHIFECA